MRSLLSLAGLLASTVALASTDLPGPAWPEYPDPSALEQACQRNLKTAVQRVHVLERQPANVGWINAYDDLNARLEDLSGPVFVLSNVHPSKPLRAAAEACELLWQEFFSTLGQNPKLYRALRDVKPSDAIDAELRKLSLAAFEDAGVSLPVEPRKRAKAINDRVAALSQSFDRNIRDENLKLAFTEAELSGVPPAVWKETARDGEGRFLLGLDYPTYVPVVQAAELPATRERMWRAKINEGGAANLKLLDEIAKLRKEYAGLFGFASYADFTLRRRMAQTPARAQDFLNEVKSAVALRERQELEELRQAKARDLGQPLDSTRLNRWDAAYYTERVRRERYAVDQEAFRIYFPPEESLRFALRVIERMFGVQYTRVANPKLWSPDAHAYRVSDAATGQALATLLVDLYPREGKYNHAAVWSYRNGSVRLARAPQAALVVNLDRKGLTLDELETLLHELGHAVHNNLSSTRHSSLAGTGVLRDFVEAPSQMLEDWVYDRRVLNVFQEVCPACPSVPDDLLAKAIAAKDYGKGVANARQQLFASFDLALHAADAPEPMALWQRLEGDTPLGHVAGTMFPAGFSHVAGGYAAGYYGYLWSLVVAMDMRTAFDSDKLDAQVGARYRSTILARGGERAPQHLVREFLGRETNAKAFFDYLRK